MGLYGLRVRHSLPSDFRTYVSKKEKVQFSDHETGCTLHIYIYAHALSYVHLQGEQSGEKVTITGSRSTTYEVEPESGSGTYFATL